ncbi:TPA: glutamate dehydrogenase, partial [Proteus mirabilis]|nr:glutamate dehydrogenase [Proteus mirabilis]
MNRSGSLSSFLEEVEKYNAHQPEYHQAVREVFTTLWPFLEKNPQYREQSLLERLVEPERI